MALAKGLLPTTHKWTEYEIIRGTDNSSKLEDSVKGGQCTMILLS